MNVTKANRKKVIRELNAAGWRIDPDATRAEVKALLNTKERSEAHAAETKEKLLKASYPMDRELAIAILTEVEDALDNYVPVEKSGQGWATAEGIHFTQEDFNVLRDEGLKGGRYGHYFITRRGGGESGFAIQDPNDY